MSFEIFKKRIYLSVSQQALTLNILIKNFKNILNMHKFTVADLNFNVRTSTNQVLAFHPINLYTCLNFFKGIIILLDLDILNANINVFLDIKHLFIFEKVICQN